MKANKFKRCFFYGLVCLLGLGVSVIRAADHYVVPPGTAGATPADPYTNWATAGTNIIEVVNAALTNAMPRVVWVTNGAHCLTNQVMMNGIITLKSFSGNYSNTLVYAGWPAYTNRCFYVVNTGVVDGLTISNGHFMGSNDNFGGGGAYVGTNGIMQNCRFINNINSNPGGYGGGGGAFIGYKGIVSNCVFVSNICYSVAGGHARNGYGGGILIYGGLALNCTILSNYSSSGGGGAFINISYTGVGDVVSNCFISYNTSAGSGGGAWANGGLFLDCTINNNYAAGNGGGVENNGNIRNCAIINNACGGYGGGIDTDWGSFVSNSVVAGNRCSSASYGGGGIGTFGYYGSLNQVIACQISNNVCAAGRGGGGVFITNGVAGYALHVVFRNCLISNNTNLFGWGGGVNSGNNGEPGSAYGLINCTIVNNYSTNEGGGIAAFGTSNIIVNCIITGNNSYSNKYPDVYNTGGNSNNYWYCCANVTSAPLASGQGNITNDPVFAGPGNWRLNGRSPGVNAGSNQNWMTNAIDLDGRLRIRYATVDMGAYEAVYDGTVAKYW